MPKLPVFQGKKRCERLSMQDGVSIVGAEAV